MNKPSLNCQEAAPPVSGGRKAYSSTDSAKPLGLPPSRMSVPRPAASTNTAGNDSPEFGPLQNLKDHLVTQRALGLPPMSAKFFCKI